MRELIKRYKEAPKDQIHSYCMPIKIQGKACGRLRPITINTLENPDEINMIMNWRKHAQQWFSTQFPVTEIGTKDWLTHFLNSDDRILFFVENEKYTPIGHIGLIHYNPEKKICEYDNLVRGDIPVSPEFIFHALMPLGKWIFLHLDVETTYLRVLSDNERAIRLYHKFGFQEIQRVPLHKQIEGAITRWVPLIDQPYEEVQRYMVTMRLKRTQLPDILKKYAEESS